jgi:hypothetical protein
MLVKIEKPSEREREKEERNRVKSKRRDEEGKYSGEKERERQQRKEGLRNRRKITQPEASSREAFLIFCLIYEKGIFLFLFLSSSEIIIQLQYRLIV